ncbi:hypothetical protein ACQ4LE_008140 [Meloidogyne hapla]|uniref:Uncharacterized protein n=1 Tax=Meloidogyne hapla TaxID=6305 RepID=A0A1I8BM25_MELHA
MSGLLQNGSTLCSSQRSSNSAHPQLKPILMARNSSLGENVPPSSYENRSQQQQQQNHLAPPPVAPDSPRPQKSDQSPLASVGLTVPLPNTGANTAKK